VAGANKRGSGSEPGEKPPPEPHAGGTKTYAPVFPDTAALLRTELAQLERRDWELVSVGAILVVLLVGTILAAIFPVGRAFGNQIIRIVPRELFAPLLYGLVAIVLLLNVYLIVKKRLVANLQKYLINLELQLAETRESVLYDPLTQLYSRRVCDEILPKELSRAARLKRPVSILVVEVDNFRETNAHYGHMFGDRLLQEIAGLLKNTARASDLVFRFGGDEFLLLLPDTDAAGVQALRRRLDKAGRGLSVSPPSGHRMAISFSAGAATFRPGQSAPDLLTEAEAALYEEQTRAPRSAPSSS